MRIEGTIYNIDRDGLPPVDDDHQVASEYICRLAFFQNGSLYTGVPLYPSESDDPHTWIAVNDHKEYTAYNYVIFDKSLVYYDYRAVDD